ncbi:unnamed protein product [Arctogadus glacialis]
MKATCCGGSVNQLGGTFLNGRPLAHPMRRRIIDLATQGVRPSEISKMIRVSNGCVSKILSRFHKTGLLDPKAMGGSRPRLLTSEVVAGIIQCKRKNPTIFGWEIRRKLATQSVCKPSQVPSVSSINRFLRKLHLDRGPMCLETNGAHPDSTLDEACEQEAWSDDWKRKDSLIQNRTIYTPRQSDALEQAFSQSQYADMYTREKLSAKIHLPEDKIKVWFSNRRAKWRRETKHQEKSQPAASLHHKVDLAQRNSTGVHNTTSQQTTLREMKPSHTLDTRETRESLAWKTLTNYHLLRKKCMGDYEHLPPVTMPSPPPQMNPNEVFPSSLTVNMRNPSCRLAERYPWPVCHHYPASNTLLPFTYNVTQCWNPQGADFSLVPCPTNEGLRLAHHQDMVYE